VTLWQLKYDTSFSELEPGLAGRLASEVNDWDAADINALFLPKDTEIQDGKIWVSVNDSTVKKFIFIPPQKALDISLWDRKQNKSVMVFGWPTK